MRRTATKSTMRSSVGQSTAALVSLWFVQKTCALNPAATGQALLARTTVDDHSECCPTRRKVRTLNVDDLDRWAGPIDAAAYQSRSRMRSFATMLAATREVREADQVFDADDVLVKGGRLQPG